MTAIGRLLRRPDFRRHPLRAIRRRVWWRLRWALSSEPWLLSLDAGPRLVAPRCGAAALIYYQGASEPETARLLLDLLRPGMVFLDLGAHLGEYTVLAGNAVAPGGIVHAFEPDPRMFSILEDNLRLNSLENVVAHQLALSDRVGFDEFIMCREPSLSSLQPPLASPDSAGQIVAKAARVMTTTLDALREKVGRRVDMVKMDIEGAEIQVLAGATEWLELPADESPLWIFEFAPENLSRFGASPADLIREFNGHGLTVLRQEAGGRLTPVDATRPPRELLNLVATKDPDGVQARLRNDHRSPPQ